MAQTNLLKPDRVQNEVIIIINFIYNAPVPVLQKRAPSTVQLHISGSIHSQEIHALKTTIKKKNVSS